MYQLMQYAIKAVEYNKAVWGNAKSNVCDVTRRARQMTDIDRAGWNWGNADITANTVRVMCSNARLITRVRAPRVITIPAGAPPHGGCAWRFILVFSLSTCVFINHYDNVILFSAYVSLVYLTTIRSRQEQCVNVPSVNMLYIFKNENKFKRR